MKKIIVRKKKNLKIKLNNKNNQRLNKKLRNKIV